MTYNVYIDGHTAVVKPLDEQPGVFAKYRIEIEDAGVFDVLATRPNVHHTAWLRWQLENEKEWFRSRRHLVQHLIRQNYVEPPALHATKPNGDALCGLPAVPDVPSGKLLTCLACRGILRHIGRHYHRGRKL